MATRNRQFVSAVLLFLTTSAASAQTTSGTIAGRITDIQNLALPDATVEAVSPNLQGVRATKSSTNGDYILTLLPPGIYTVTVTAAGFESQQQTIVLAPTETAPLNVTMGPAGVSETISVVAASADVLTQTAQVATNFKQDLLNLLPTTRSIDSALLLAPSVHPTGPAGAFSIAGAMSFESLFLINGVTVNENTRGQPLPLMIEDAIQEMTVATSGISSEFGRFTGGVVNVVTKSGGNTFSGSLRDTLYNDHWRTLTPFEKSSVASDPAHTDTRIDKTVPTYEYTFGGPVLKDRLWFFTAGRLQKQTEQRQTVAPLNVPYTADDNTKRFEGKATYSPTSNHNVQLAYTRIVEEQVNATFNTATSMDLRSLYTVKLPQRLWTLNYNGVLTPSLFLESRFSSREMTFIGRGAQSTDLINGTMVVDRARGNLRYWSPTLCGVCDPEKRGNDDTFVKASYFLPTRTRGSHTMALGYDTFDDKRFANNHQSGSDYRILGTTSIVQGSTISPQFLPGSTIIQFNPIATSSNGTHFRTHAIFVNDQWQAAARLRLNLGIRWDKNRGRNSANQLVANDSSWSPRLGFVWSPTTDARWSVTTSFSRYLAGLQNVLTDSSSAAGNPGTLQWVYLGPPINPTTTSPLVSTDVAIRQVFDWFNAAGGTRLQPAAAVIPGFSVRVGDSVRSPNALEWTGGVSHQVTSRSTLRGDVVYRTYHDFYSGRIDQTTGVVVDPYGNRSDLAIIENTDLLTRRYAAITLSGNYRFGTRATAGGNYTLSRLWGNFDGEAANGALFADLSQYPEYRRAAWYAPDGDLSADQRHRASLWFTSSVPAFNDLTVSLLQQLTSGLPYGALGQVDARPYVTGVAYATPQGTPVENYYFTARDAFRTAASYRTDLGLTYRHRVNATRHSVDLFGQLQVLNVLNQFQLCGCGADVFNSGGAVALSRIGSSVLNATNTPTLERFNPFTAVPVRAVNWNYGSNFGTALNRFAYTSPRTLRISFGVLF